MEGMYRSVLQTEEGGRKDVCTAGRLCVSTRNKHLYNIYIHLLFLLRSCFCHVCEKTEVVGAEGRSEGRSLRCETTSTLKEESREKKNETRSLPFSQRQNKSLWFGRPVGTRRGRSMTSGSVKG